jgi:hypothetical protein
MEELRKLREPRGENRRDPVVQVGCIVPKFRDEARGAIRRSD